MLIADESIVKNLLVILGILFFLSFLYAAVVSFKEKEKRAAGRFIMLMIFLPLPYFVLFLLDPEQGVVISEILLLFTILSILILFIPVRYDRRLTIQAPRAKFDERDIMFSRRILKKGSPEYDDYYSRNPANLEKDEQFRSEPGLLSPGSTNYDPFIFSAANASFFTIEQLKHKVDGPVSKKKEETDPEKISRFIRNWAVKLGARDCGITFLKEYHKYSIGGRTYNYGEEVQCEHRYAIAFTVEMNHETTSTGPNAPIVMESAQQYVDSGVIAVTLAQYIRNLGYPARAHIDGNYQVICPLVARDAGLGEMGRMGLLMTPKLGPRVRIAVVTTDLDLITTNAKVDRSVVDFCRFCKKCAETCPSLAIPFDDREKVNGVIRWQIDSDKCFRFWCSCGTDCGRCMAVCPYSHPNNLLHNFVRWGIRNSTLFSRLALLLDDYFYGKKPPVRPFPEWMKMQ